MNFRERWYIEWEHDQLRIVEPLGLAHSAFSNVQQVSSVSSDRLSTIDIERIADGFRVVLDLRKPPEA